MVPSIFSGASSVGKTAAIEAVHVNPQQISKTLLASEADNSATLERIAINQAQREKSNAPGTSLQREELKSGQKSNTQLLQNPSVIRSEIATNAIEVVCGTFAEEVLKQISEPASSDTTTLAAAIFDEMAKKWQTGRPTFIRGTCLRSAVSSGVEWSIQMLSQATTVSNSAHTVTCKDMTHCRVESSDTIVSIIFYPVGIQAAIDSTSLNPAQPVVQRRSLPVELDTLSSSATSFHQYSSFRESNFVTLTMTLVVLLYLYIFNFRR